MIGTFAIEITSSDLWRGLVGFGLGGPVAAYYARKWWLEVRADRLLKVSDVETIRTAAEVRIETIRAAAAVEREQLATERAEWHQRRNDFQRDWGAERMATADEIVALKGQLAHATLQADRFIQLYNGCREREAGLRERLARIEERQDGAGAQIERLERDVAQTPRRKDDEVEDE